MTKPRESDLRSADHDRWAAAAAVCRHPAGFCGADGYCHYGDCFRRPRREKPQGTLEERVEDLEQQVAELMKARAASDET